MPSLKKTTLILIACALSISFAASVNGQIPVSLSSIELTLSTENPSPGQNITVSATSFNVDLESSDLTWTIDGKVVSAGYGKKEITVSAPDLGKVMQIKVTAETQNGNVISGSIKIIPAAVDMIMETDGYVPPFFPGKIEPVYQNSVKVIAIPHLVDSSGKEYSPKNLIYQWKKNSQLIPESSGYGKQSILVPGDLVPRSYTISVEVSTPDEAIRGSGLKTTVFQSPSITFYVNDPLYGSLLNKEVASKMRIGAQKETGILAVPFGFNKPLDSLGNLAMKWLINGVERPELASGDSIILRAPDGVEGSSQIELTVKNSKYILQESNAGFTTMFTNKQSFESNAANTF